MAASASRPAIVWPKSGSTWLRAVLTNYLADDDQPASINALVGNRGRACAEFDDCLDVASADMSDEEVARRLPGQWRSALDAAQVQAIVDGHRDAMERLGYLP